MNTAKLAKAKAKLDENKFAKVEFVEGQEVYKRLREVNERFNESNAINKEFLEEVQSVVKNALSVIAQGIKITNADEIKIEPTFNTPEVIVPEVKMPAINVPSPTVIQEVGVYNKYFPADIYKEGSTTYHGYLSKDGEWFILREVDYEHSTTYRFATGKSRFKSAFHMKDKQDYKYIDEVEL